MGTILRVWKTIPTPVGAIIGKKGQVSWIARGKKRTGKMSGMDRVSVQTDTWTAQFVDETGKVRRVPTKTTNRNVAEKVLAQLEKEVDRIKSGVITRDELDKAQARQMPLEQLLEQYRTKMTAEGNTARYISETLRKIDVLFQECGIDTLAKIRRESIDQWIAGELKSKVLTSRTINSYVAAVKSFVRYITDTGMFTSNPLKSIRELNQEIDQRKKRRAMTKDEVERLLTVTASGVCRTIGSPDERILIYQLLLGTGLRSTELSLLTPSQIDFDRCRLRVEASKTKNKKADILPLRPDLVQSLKERVKTLRIKPHERIFLHDEGQIRRAFYADLRVAGIERKSSDGRSIDVHSLRKTFGTMLAMAGVPLTMVQRLMRHSTPLLTAKLYIDVDPVNMAQALEQLPVFSPVIQDSPKESPNDSI